MAAKLSNDRVRNLFDEVAPKFDALSHPYSVRRRASALASQVIGRSIELGGGTGAVLSAMGDQARAIHSDIALQMCRTARRKLRCPTLCLDAEAIPVADESIDTVICSEMLYYLEHPDRCIAEAHRVLRPGGRLLICTPNSTAKMWDCGRTILRKLGIRRMYFDDGSPTFIPLKRLRFILEKRGFAIQTTKKIVVLPIAGFDPLNRILERTWLRHLGMFTILVARKTSPAYVVRTTIHYPFVSRFPEKGTIAPPSAKPQDEQRCLDAPWDESEAGDDWEPAVTATPTDDRAFARVP